MFAYYTYSFNTIGVLDTFHELFNIHFSFCFSQHMIWWPSTVYMLMFMEEDMPAEVSPPLLAHVLPHKKRMHQHLGQLKNVRPNSQKKRFGMGKCLCIKVLHQNKISLSTIFPTPKKFPQCTVITVAALLVAPRWT